MSMSDIEVVEKLKKEALQGIVCPGFPEGHRLGETMATIRFLEGVYAIRGDMARVTVPVGFLQDICTLAVDGFELAFNLQERKLQQEAIQNLLKRIWWSFTMGALMRWVWEQPEDENALWYSCFEVPRWFIEEARKRR